MPGLGGRAGPAVVGDDEVRRLVEHGQHRAHRLGLVRVQQLAAGGEHVHAVDDPHVPRPAAAPRLAATPSVHGGSATRTSRAGGAQRGGDLQVDDEDAGRVAGREQHPLAAAPPPWPAARASARAAPA